MAFFRETFTFTSIKTKMGYSSKLASMDLNVKTYAFTEAASGNS